MPSNCTKYDIVIYRNVITQEIFSHFFIPLGIILGLVMTNSDRNIHITIIPNSSNFRSQLQIMTLEF